jgi:hypothetical protein
MLSYKTPLISITKTNQLKLCREIITYFEIHTKPGKTSVSNVQISGNAKTNGTHKCQCVSKGYY